MEVVIVNPGQEAYEALPAVAGKQRVEYFYRTQRGVLFSCISDTLDAARDRCEDWLLNCERH